MTTARLGPESQVLWGDGEFVPSRARALRAELKASWAARPIELVGRRGELAPWMEAAGGQVLATLLGQAVQHADAERGLLVVRRAEEARVAVFKDSVDGDQATVRTRIVTAQGTEIPVDYRMLRRGDRWMAYDVAIEGVSLVANYRTQFNRVIQSSSYRALVDKLKSKGG